MSSRWHWRPIWPSRNTISSSGTRSRSAGALVFGPFRDLGGSEMTAGAGINGLPVATVRSTGGVKLRSGTKAGIHQPHFLQFFQRRLIDRCPPALIIRPVGPLFSGSHMPNEGPATAGPPPSGQHSAGDSGRCPDPQCAAGPLPPFCRALSHASRQHRMFPRWIRPLGDGANLPRHAILLPPPFFQTSLYPPFLAPTTPHKKPFLGGCYQKCYQVKIRKPLWP